MTTQKSSVLVFLAVTTIATINGQSNIDKKTEDANQKMALAIEKAKEFTSKDCSKPFSVISQIPGSTIPTTVVFAGKVVDEKSQSYFHIEINKAGAAYVTFFDETKNEHVFLRLLTPPGITCV